MAINRGQGYPWLRMAVIGRGTHLSCTDAEPDQFQISFCQSDETVPEEDDQRRKLNPAEQLGPLPVESKLMALYRDAAILAR